MDTVRRLKLLSLCFILSTLATAQSFTSKMYTVGTNPQKLIRANLNNDGAEDIVTANSDGTITVLVNNGDGTFRRQDATARTTGTGLMDIAAGDINKDGKTDLIVLESLANSATNINLLTGRGDGTFNAPVTVATQEHGAALAVADFNGDGNLDIVFGWNIPGDNGQVSANITIYYGDGSGGFPTHTDMIKVGAQADYANGESGYQINHINVGDFNHDFKQDFAITECCAGSFVQLGSGTVFTNDGAGTAFTQHQFYIDPALELRVADVNKDGQADILVPYRGCHTPCFGVGVFTSPASSPNGFDMPGPANFVPEAFPSATAADFGGGTSVAYSVAGYTDSTPSTETGLIAFARPNSSGGYSIFSTYNTGPLALRYLTYADWNKDGRQDLAAIADEFPFTGAVNSQVAVYTNTGVVGGSCVASTNRTVKICSPAAGSTVTSPVHVVAGLRSDSGVSAAQIYLDGTKIYQGPAGTVSVDQSISMSTGTHKITVKGWDSSGSFSSSVSVTVSASTTSCSATANRTVNICAPANGATLQNPFQLIAGLRSDSGITAAQIYLDGTKVFQAGAGTTSINQAMNLTLGTHKITVKGWDSAGSFSSSISITVSSSAPPPSCSAPANRTVNICSPTSGSSPQSPVHVLAGLRSGTQITAAQIYLDGKLVYQGPAGTTTVDQEINMVPGSHKITVKGWDSSGSFSSSVTFNSI